MYGLVRQARLLYASVRRFCVPAADLATDFTRCGKIYQQEYSCGHPLYSVKEVGTADITGTKQTFWPDDTIFTVTEYKFDILQARMRELAYLNKGITISLTDRRIKEEDGSFNASGCTRKVKGCCFPYAMTALSFR